MANTGESSDRDVKVLVKVLWKVLVKVNTGESSDKEVKLSRDVWSGSDNSTGIPGQGLRFNVKHNDKYKYNDKHNDKYNDADDFPTWTQQAGQDVLGGGDLAIPDHPVDDCPKCIHCHELNIRVKCHL